MFKRNNIRRKKNLIIAFTVIAFFLYYMAIDPDLGIITDLPFGTGLVLTLQIFLIATIGIISAELFPTVLMNDFLNEDELLSKTAATEPNSAGLLMIARALRLLGASIIVAASILGFTLVG